ncbi:MAG: dTDP-4-dehydrorhamnose reductase [Chlamydiales bacterium]|nr:dTDP-4-dehydrorhamnose reductase [Chlamydiales bacterium]
MKLWITGAGGLLGEALKQYCKDKKISYLSTARADLDVTDCDQASRFIDDNSPTHIINCAAYTAVDRAETERDKAYAVNAAGPANLAELAKKRLLPLIHISTNYVFNGKRSAPQNETDPCDPLNVYGASKLEGERRVLDCYPEACVIRTSWLFGRGGKNFISSLYETLKKERVIRACHDQWGRATYSRDLAEAILVLLDKSGIYHFANHGAISRYQAACDIRAEAEKRGIPLACEEILPVPSSEFTLPAARPDSAILATDKIEELIKIRPWKTVLGEYLDAIK